MGSLPFEINEENYSFLIKDVSKFKIVDVSESFYDINKVENDSDYENGKNVGDVAFSLSFTILDEILILLSGLNWGSIEKKIKYLIDTKIENRLENYNEQPNLLLKYLTFLRGLTYIITSIIIFVVNFIIFIVIIIFGKPRWLQNNIFGNCLAFDLGTFLLNCMFSFTLREGVDLNLCISIFLLVK